MTAEQYETASGLKCVEFVDLVTAYLDGALRAELDTRVEEHLLACEGCRTALAQWRTVVTLTGRLKEADIDNVDALIRDRLLNAFRRARRR